MFYFLGYFLLKNAFRGNHKSDFNRLQLPFKKYIYRVLLFTELRPKKTHFSGRKNYLTELKMKYVKFQNYTFMKIKTYFMKDKNLCLKKPRTLGA